MAKDIIEQPPEYWPKIDELTGDLARIAAAIKEWRPGHGLELTLFLAQVFRGQPLYLRNIDYLIRQWRDDAIRRQYDSGVKVSELVTRWDLCLRWVEDILARSGGDCYDKYLRLF